MTTLFESPFATRLAWTLVHFLWEGTLLTLLAWMTFTLLRHSRPQLRYLAGCGFLLACLASVGVTFAMLVPQQVGAPVMGFTSPPHLHGPGAFTLLAIKAPALKVTQWHAQLAPHLPTLLRAWTLGVLLLTLRTAGGWLWLRRLQTDATPIPEPTCLKRLLSLAGIQRTVRLVESARVAVPMCQGLWHPVILLPLGFFMHLDPLAAEAVLAHEIAHLRRWDGLVNGGQNVIEVLLFFHPAVWWISRRIRAEREHCCDDAAVQTCGDALFYAETLSRLDDLRAPTPSLALSARGGNLMERLRRLILSTPPKLHLTTPGLASIVAFSCLSALPIQARKPLLPLPAIAQVPFEGAPGAGALRISDSRFGSGFWDGNTGLKVPEVPKTTTPPPSLPPVPEGSLAPAPLSNPPPPPTIYLAQTPPSSPWPPSSSIPVPLTFNRDGWKLVPVPNDVRVLEEPEGLPADLSEPAGTTGATGSGSAFKWGIRSFQFVLQPHETLRAKLKPIDAKRLQMLLDVPTSKDPGTAQILAINKDERPYRRRQLEFKNPTDRPYALVLFLKGAAGYEYHLDLERIP